MVSIQVLDEIDNMRFQASNQYIELCTSAQTVDDLLQCPGTVLVDRYFEQVELQSVQDHIQIALIAISNHLLHQIVTKRIYNQFVHVRMNFVKDNGEIV